MPLKTDPEIAAALERISIVLVEPKYAENIGSAARTMMNMGLSSLIVVRREAPDRETMLKLATHKAASLIEKMEIYPDLATALAPFNLVVGTTTRLGRQRRPPNTPRETIKNIIPMLTENRLAIIFGPEHRGLTNDDLKFCRFTSTIPTSDFASLNLAQAVAIFCYEIYHGLLYGDEPPPAFVPKQATSVELEGMYAHLEELLTRIDFLKKNHDQDEYWMNSIRKFLSRLGMQSKEVKMIRGFCRQFLWYEENREK
ncbi:MAG: RNA methyltransferase [Proteobacteria bacterium]|nr:RNA methyltransferase [Pseudomonadota bacterium]MBU1737885.1 RNA methyltransferase [Pseudomonadota bacterium]